MSRMIGTVSMGIRAPMIRVGDDLVEIVSNCILEAMKEDEIFENHFGGFYYVFVRGCKENTSNGIYAHTWNNYSELKKDYESIKKSFAV